MRNISRDLNLNRKFAFGLPSAVTAFSKQQSGLLHPKLYSILVILCLLMAFAVQSTLAQSDKLQVFDAEGDQVASLELLEHQSVKYVLESELKSLFSGTGAYDLLIGRVSITMMGKRIVLMLRQRQIQVDDKEYVLSHPPVSISGRIAIPLEFLEKILPIVIDKQVTLDREKWILHLTDEPFTKESGTDTDTPVLTSSDAEFRVIIDPGHGGSDQGTRTKIGVLEKDQTLKVAEQIKNMLAGERDVDVYLTRTSDRVMTTAERINRANKLRGHIYISIHFNWSPSQRSKGFRIYVNSNQARLGSTPVPGADMFSGGQSISGRSPEPKRFLTQSKRIAKEVAEHLKKAGLTGEQNKEIFLADMSNLSMPGVLVEVLYFSNPQDRTLLSRPDFVDAIARAFCDSILVLRNAMRDKDAL